MAADLIATQEGRLAPQRRGKRESGERGSTGLIVASWGKVKLEFSPYFFPPSIMFAGIL